jgi:hypothetical protein
LVVPPRPQREREQEPETVCDGIRG